MARHTVTALSRRRQLAWQNASRLRASVACAESAKGRSSSVRAEAAGVPVERLVRQARQGRVHPSQLDAAAGCRADVFDGRPVIGICNTWSELTPCNAHLRQLAEHVKRGVWEAGGLPFEFPVTSTRRDEPAADRDAVPQSRQHGRRGVDPRQPDRRRRPALRLRQDDAVARHGRGELRPAGDRRLGRPDAERQVSAARTSASATSGSSARTSRPA